MKRIHYLLALLFFSVILCSCAGKGEHVSISSDKNYEENRENEIISSINVEKEEASPLLNDNTISDLLSQDLTQPETEYITGDDYDSLVSHFEIVKEDREGGFVYVCVDGMEIHKYKVDNGIFDGNVDISFKVQDTDFAGHPNKTILVQLTNGIVYSDAGHMSYDAVFPACKDIVSHYIANSDNIFLYEEVEHDTTKMGYLKDFDYENRTIKIDYATKEISSPSGGIRLEGNDGIFEEEKLSEDVRFEFFYGQSCEGTLKGFQDRMDRDSDSSMGYYIYFKDGEVVAIVEVPSS